MSAGLCMIHYYYYYYFIIITIIIIIITIIIIIICFDFMQIFWQLTMPVENFDILAPNSEMTYGMPEGWCVSRFSSARPRRSFHCGSLIAAPFLSILMQNGVSVYFTGTPRNRTQRACSTNNRRVTQCSSNPAFPLRLLTQFSSLTALTFPDDYLLPM